MNNDLLEYYQKELGILRQQGRELARRYPKLAGRLQLSGDTSPDPHVERLIESFALIAARIHGKIDDSFPEITEALLGNLYPNLIRPVPARGIVQFSPAHEQNGPIRLPRGTKLEQRLARFATSDQVPCRFRTCSDVEVWPIHIDAVHLERFAMSPLRRTSSGGDLVLRIRLSCPEGWSFGALAPSSLRLYIDGGAPVVQAIYELMLTSVRHVLFLGSAGSGSSTPAWQPMPGVTVDQIGFGLDEGAYDYDPRSFLAYRLLHEYFTFTEKFHFVDLRGLAPALATCGSSAELAFVFAPSGMPVDIDDLAANVDASTLRLGCAPFVNLFTQTAEPIRLTHAAPGYPVVPDVRRPSAYEVYSVDQVTLIRRQDGVTREIVPPLYSPDHPINGGTSRKAWYAAREPAVDGVGGTMLHLVDPDLGPESPTDGVLSLVLTCTNRDVPNRMTVGDPAGDFVLPEGSDAVGTIQALGKPRRPIRLPVGGDSQWRLISHLSLNHLTLLDVGSLRGLLEIYNLADPRSDPLLHNSVQQQIAGIVEVRSRPGVVAAGPLGRRSLCSGTEIEIVLDEDQFVGAGAFLFACVLDHFFPLYCAANSFTRLSVISRQRKDTLGIWPTRTGTDILI